MTNRENQNGQAIAAYIAGARDRTLPSEVADMARLCLADFMRTNGFDDFMLDGHPP